MVFFNKALYLYLYLFVLQIVTYFVLYEIAVSPHQVMEVVMVQ